MPGSRAQADDIAATAGSEPVATSRDSDDSRWYYNIELSPGHLTNGERRPNLSLVRVLFRDVPMAGLRCLDVGTMEGVVPTLMARAGAAEVAATDWVDRTARIERVKAAFGVDFAFHQVVRLPNLGNRLDGLFDIVNFAGVMYHAINPLGTLAAVRGMCRVGGLMLVETAVVHSDERLMYFDPRQLGDCRYFYPTTAFFDIMLRLLRLRPLALAFLGPSKRMAHLRLAVLCRSETVSPVRDESERWFCGDRLASDMKKEAGLDFDQLETDAPALPVPSFCSGGIPVGSETVYEVVDRSRPYRWREDEAQLRLDATF